MMRAGRIIAALVAASISGVVSSEAQATFRLTDVGTLGGSETYPVAINARGTVVGDSTTPDGTLHGFVWTGTAILDAGTVGGTTEMLSVNSSGAAVGYSTDAAGMYHAVVWSNGVLRDLGGPLAPGAFVPAFAWSINDSGHVAGTALVGSEATTHAFLWDGDQVVDLGTLGGSDSVVGNGNPRTINQAGWVVGTSFIAGNQAQHAFLWDGSAMRDLGTLDGMLGSNAAAINSSGQVVSNAFGDGTSTRAFLWTNGVVTDLGSLGSRFTSAAAINDRGEVVGSSVPADYSGDHAFLWNGSDMVDLGTLGGRFSVARSVNNLGYVVGGSTLPGESVNHAFLVRAGTMEDLNELIDVADPLKPYIELVEAVDINDAGQIAAWGVDTRTNERHTFVVSPAMPDSTPPVIDVSLNGTLGLNGWYVSDAAIAWNVNDAESAIASTTGCAPVSVLLDTPDTTFTCTATSTGGTSSASATIKRDATSPTVSAAATPPANANGWRRQNVTVLFTGTDTLSGVASCDAPIVLASDGVGQNASGRCYDAAGNASNAGTVTAINIDKTDPTAAVSSPTNGAVYARNQVVLASYSCGDTLSGVASCAGPVANGQRIDTSKKVKNAKFTVTVTDRAGNQTKTTVSYEVN